MTKLARANQFNRSGNVHYRVEQNENGETSVTLAVDFESAPVPERSYIADYFEVHRTDADVMMVFGKADFPSQTKLRNKVEIYFPFHPFMHQLWKSARKMHGTLRNSFETNGRKPKPQGVLTEPIEKVQTLAANNALIVISAGQCVMDFFLIAAKDLWLKTKKGDPLNVDAIVRVFMSENVLLGFLDRCDELAKDLGAELNVSLEETEENDEIVEPIELR